ncbi:MAG: hypothetical protein LBP76_00260 [Treponema sp.]|nr:hypothetical protein [Treponema sp.]
MKKFFISILILAVLGGIVFYFGWVEFSVPPGAYGIMRSRTHGMDKQLIRNGEFRWEWYKVIPANVEILVLRPKTVVRSFTDTGKLPSGETYESFLGIKADFSYEAEGSFSFNIKPDTFPDLALTMNIENQSDFDAYSEELAGDIETFLVRNIRTGSQSHVEDIIMRGNTDTLIADVGKNFPNIENISLKIQTLLFPDIALYNSAKSLYQFYLEKQQEYLLAPLSVNAEKGINFRFRIDELEKYGELLTKYPILLQFLSLEQGIYSPSEDSAAPSGG